MVSVAFIFSAALVALGRIVAHLTHLPPHFVAGAFALTLPPVLVGATTGVVVKLGSRLGASRRGSVAAATGFAFGTIALVYARDFFAEPLLALITAVAICLELGGRIERSMVGFCAALAVLAKPTGAILGPMLAVHAMLKHRSLKALIGPIAGTAAGIALYFAYNYVRFGEILTFGQPVAFTLSNLPGELPDCWRVPDGGSCGTAPRYWGSQG
jgi:hypothetical protein